MSTSVVVPPLGESITQATLLRWLKEDGAAVTADEPVAELETDKANVDLPAPQSGVLRRLVQPGDTVTVGQAIGQIDAASGKPVAKAPAPSQAAIPTTPNATPKPATTPPAKAPAPSRSTAAPVTAAPTPPATSRMPAPMSTKSAPAADALSPAVRRAVVEYGIDPAELTGTGRGGRLTKQDVTAAVAARPSEPAGNSGPATEPPTAASPAVAPTHPVSQAATAGEQTSDDSPGVRRTPMTRIRKRIAERLVAAQHTAAILTTFNEVDLTEMMALRARYKEAFEKRHAIGLGVMGFFVKAASQALREFPRVNSQIDGDDIVSYDYVHLGIAVSTDRGLAVPVMRNADTMSFARIESEIKRLATAVRDGKLGLDELSGGTFTITNGGVFGSMLSTPILNPPQSAILGMHTIQKRAMVINDQIVPRQMMYLALSYDHRLIDGRDSVSFLVRIKQLLEDPARLLLEV